MYISKNMLKFNYIFEGGLNLKQINIFDYKLVKF